MRRLIALLSLLSLANLTFVRGGAACPLNGHHAQHVASASMSGHEGHDMGGMSNHEMVQPSSDDDAQPPTCLTMGPCALTLAVSDAIDVAYATGPVDRVIAISDHLPPSAALSRELPPPRA